MARLAALPSALLEWPVRRGCRWQLRLRRDCSRASSPLCQRTSGGTRFACRAASVVTNIPRDTVSGRCRADDRCKPRNTIARDNRFKLHALTASMPSRRDLSDIDSPMSAATKNVAVLGSTGSIGTSALEVIAASDGRLRAVALSAHGKLGRLLEQARRFRPRWIVATDEAAATAVRLVGVAGRNGTARRPEALAQVAAAEEVDVVLAGIVGSAGLAEHVGSTGGQENGRPGE